MLVVGASSSGTQIADELSRAGRHVVLAVGRHSRMPRRYRGMDIYSWREPTGRLSRTIDDFAAPAVARHEPSLQLIGRNEPERFGEDLDLATLQARGVRLTGRLEGIEGDTARVRDDLGETTATADRRMHRFLDAVDRHIHESGLSREVLSATRPGPVARAPAPAAIDLRGEGIGTLLLAMGAADIARRPKDVSSGSHSELRNTVGGDRAQAAQYSLAWDSWTSSSKVR